MKSEVSVTQTDCQSGEPTNYYKVLVATCTQGVGKYKINKTTIKLSILLFFTYIKLQVVIKVPNNLKVPLNS